MTQEFDLPAGWSLSRLGEVADATLGKTPRRIDYRSEGAHRVVKYRDLKAGAIDFSETKDAYVVDDPAVIGGLREVRVGDVLIGASGHDGSTVGRKLALVEELPASEDVFFVGELFRIRAAQANVDPRWFLHYFSSELGYRELQKAVAGGHLTNGRARQLVIPMAPASVQKWIADLLDTVRSKERSAGRRLASVRSLIERFRQAVLVAACSGRLTATWRRTRPHPVRSADELLRDLRSAKQQAVEQESSAALLADIPDTWRVATGNECFTFITSGSRGWAKHYTDDGPAFLRVGNLDRHRLDLDLTVVQSVTPPSSAESRRTQVREKDLLISITAEVGMVGVVPPDLGEGYVNQHVAIARPHPRLDSRYLAAFVAAPMYGEAQLDALQRGATKAGLGLDDIRALRILLPPVDEQVEIARRVDQLMSIADGIEARIDTASHRIDKSSQAVLAKAFQGDLVPTGVGS